MLPPRLICTLESVLLPFFLPGRKCSNLLSFTNSPNVIYFMHPVPSPWDTAFVPALRFFTPISYIRCRRLVPLHSHFASPLFFSQLGNGPSFYPNLSPSLFPPASLPPVFVFLSVRKPFLNGLSSCALVLEPNLKLFTWASPIFPSFPSAEKSPSPRVPSACPQRWWTSLPVGAPGIYLKLVDASDFLSPCLFNSVRTSLPFASLFKKSLAVRTSLCFLLALAEGLSVVESPPQGRHDLVPHSRVLSQELLFKSRGPFFGPSPVRYPSFLLAASG